MVYKVKKRLISLYADVVGSIDRLKPQLSDGNRITLLHSGVDFFPALEQAIHRAQSEIYLETYIFSADATACRMAHALSQAALRGVVVHVVVDGFGTANLAPHITLQWQQAGVKLSIFRPEQHRFLLSRQRLRRLHRKLVMIDRRVAFVGGINIMDDCIDHNHGALSAPRFDFAVRVEGPVVASIHLAMYRLWLLLHWRQRSRHAWTRILKYWARPLSQSQRVNVGGQKAALVLRDNLNFRHAVEQSYLDAIETAQHEIIIANAYFFPGMRFRRALYQAAARGVKITLLLQGRIEYRLQYYASQGLYDELLRAGIQVVEYAPSFLHAKVAVIDDDWATVGSSNIDPFSLLLAREANLVVRDRTFTAQLRQALQHAITHGGRAITPQYQARCSWPVRLLHTCAYALLRMGVALSGQAAEYE